LRVLRKILCSINKRKNILLGNGFSVKKSYGCKWLIDWSNSVDKKVAYKLFENKQISFFLKKIETDNPEYFFDIGAHGGLYSIIFKKRFDHLKILSFEPDRQNRYQMLSNLFLNKLENKIKVYDFGLSSDTKEVYFDIKSINNRGEKRITNDGNYKISVKPLDEVFLKKNKNCFMKIDVEGHEKDVILGSKKILKTNRCLIQVEILDENNFQDFDNLMKSLGYTLIKKIDDYYYSNYII
jgi:FkbM family methyltransferase